MPGYRTLVETDIGISRMNFLLEVKIFLDSAARRRDLAQSAHLHHGGLPRITANNGRP